MFFDQHEQYLGARLSCFHHYLVLANDVSLLHLDINQGSITIPLITNVKNVTVSEGKKEDIRDN